MLYFFRPRPPSVHRARCLLLLQNFGKLPKTSIKKNVKLVYASTPLSLAPQYYLNIAFRVGVSVYVLLRVRAIYVHY